MSLLGAQNGDPIFTANGGEHGFLACGYSECNVGSQRVHFATLHRVHGNSVDSVVEHQYGVASDHTCRQPNARVRSGTAGAYHVHFRFQRDGECLGVIAVTYRDGGGCCGLRAGPQSTDCVVRR